MKRFLCSVICLAMLLSCMALPMTQAEELPYYEIDVFSQNANFAGLQSGWFGKLIKDKFNIGLNITATNLEGGASKLATLMVEGDLGDLLNFASVTSTDFTAIAADNRRRPQSPIPSHNSARLRPSERRGFQSSCPCKQ